MCVAYEAPDADDDEDDQDALLEWHNQSRSEVTGY
jgi:hypothetical protein